MQQSHADLKLSYKYDIKFGSPTISFNANVDGIYDIKMPIETGSSFDKVLDDKLMKSYEIPQGCYLVASGPVQCIKGEEGNTSKHDAGSIIEFGKNGDTASIVLHFGKDLRQIEPFIDSDIPSNDDVKNALEKIDLESFIKNITEINYNITQVKVNSDKQDRVVLTPKSFIFTTMSSEDNEEHGVLNVWIQTNESKNEPGNPKPSFFVGDHLLPIPEGHNANIIFAKQLIEKVSFIVDNRFDLICGSNLNPYTQKSINNGIGIKFSPSGLKKYTYEKTYGKDSFKIADESLISTYKDFKSDPLLINFEQNPLFLSINDKLSLTWKWEQNFNFTVTYSQAVPRLGLVDKNEDGEVYISSSINKEFPLQDIVNIDNKNISIKFKLDKNDIKFDSKTKGKQWFDFMPIGPTTADTDPGINNDVLAILKGLLAFNIDLTSLNYFAEANILFNEQRFLVNPDSGINIPADVMLVGDIEQT